MNNLKKSLLLSFLLTAASINAVADDTDRNGKLIINEIMQSNIDCIMDDLNDFPDSWVELYNPGDAAVSLADYSIGTKTKASKAYKLPNRHVAPKGYILIYCDKVEKDLHTDFRLESGKGCVLYLFKGDEIVDCLPEELKKQPAPNIAYGRKTDGSDKWGYQLTPTPGKSNCGETVGNKQILGEPVFSEKGRVVSGSLNVKLDLSLPEGCPEGTEIYYTLNGEEPTKESYRYKRTINITKSTVVLAKLFCDGWLSPRATAQSYISHGRDITLPVISIAIKDAYLNDPKTGIYANNDGDKKKNDWRRPINIEFFFDADKPSDINQLCETRVAGGATRGAPLKTLAVYANKRFGTKRLEYEFFPEDRPGQTDFKSLMLRNAGNDFDYLYMRDAIIQRNAARHIDLDWQAYRPAIVYINGTYRGMLNIRERSNEDNIYTNHDGLEDLDMLENWEELKEGSWDNFERFKAFYNEKGHTLEEYEQWMDVNEFLNLMIVNLYHVNLDFPGNNIVMWRPIAEGGKWRWIMKDTDFGLGLYGRPYNYEIFKWLYNPYFDMNNAWANRAEHTVLFRNMMENQDIKKMFIDRCLIYTGDFLNSKGIRETWDPMYEVIKYEYPKHRALFNAWWPNYSEELKNARNWVSQRDKYFINQLCSYYNLGTPVSLTVRQSTNDADKASIRFNGHRLSKGTFEGKFLVGRDIILEGEEVNGKTVNGWKVIANGSIQEYQGSRLEIKMPQGNSVNIIANTGTESGINDVRTADTVDNAIYDLKGRKISPTSVDDLPKGIYIIGGKKVVKQ